MMLPIRCTGRENGASFSNERCVLDRCNSGHRLAESGVGAPRQGDHMVDAFASDRSDQSFGKAVCQGDLAR